MTIPCRSALLALAAGFACAHGHAHELRPAYLNFQEQRPGEFDVLWKTPMRSDARLALTPELSGETEASDVHAQVRAGAAIQRWTLSAPELCGQTLRIRGLEGTMTDVVVEISFLDGTEWTHLLTPRAPAATIPFAPVLASAETPASHVRPNAPFFAALVGWAVMCLAAALTQTPRIHKLRRPIIGVAYLGGIIAAFVLLRSIVEFGFPA